MPKITPHQPQAMARSRPPWNSCDRTAIWQISSAPPLAPCRKRATISVTTLSATPHINDVRPNPAIAMTNMRLRPKRSASVPTAISTVVTAIV